MSLDLELKRFNTLQALEIVESEPEASFDQMARLAADIFEAPIVLIALADGERHWFKSHIGIDFNEVPACLSFCVHTLEKGDVLVVPDTCEDARFADNPFVICAPHVRFYAGAPLRYEGALVGTFCILDSRPRDFSAAQVRHLRMMAESVSLLIAQRKDGLVRKAAIRKLQEGQRKLELMEEVAGVGYWQIHVRTRECFWSRGVYAIHGLNREDYTPDLISAPDHFHPFDRVLVTNCVQQAMDLGEDFHFEARLMRADGEERIVYSKGMVETDEAGRPEWLFGILEDITEQSHVEETLRAAKAQAEAHQQAKSDFLANMSHEIRTPLTTILGYANLLTGVTDLPKDARHYIGRINKAGEALLSLVTDVLDFSKLEAGQVTLNPQAIDCRALADDIIEQFAALTTSRHVDLSFVSRPDAPLWLMLDDTRMRQVLYNLVGNACKFTQNGYVDLKLVLHGEGAQTRLRVEVRDSGPGLSPLQQARLFKRFNQVDNSINRKYGGSGLGLSICYEIVRLMGGEIGVESAPGEGSCFWLEIPAAVAVAPAPVVKRDLRPVFLEDRKVLIVDDHPINRELIRLLLKDYGLDIYEACDGAEAVAMCEKTHFDLVFMDIQMPVLDGISATRAMTGWDGDRRPSAIVALTAAAQKLPEDAHACGFTGVLSKPIDLPQFYATLYRCLEGDAPARLAV
ncbi:ATP-binding protein [Asticcacaulis sp. EMRT-3]|uniref:GAF domain-containing hybrid sensor histidine kinase/response regulator n=1 Tax=Asticcacaulis sp. EMRT-3 TaxID=3040349 RepID=UPI0024AECEB8|nr:ATP-binding protein [Asticcacaulis sp. EMRT-3]MDI7774900.1 ATP-binding protein [Asticcacaulis sp. EMRT-3]